MIDHDWQSLAKYCSAGFSTSSGKEVWKQTGDEFWWDAHYWDDSLPSFTHLIPLWRSGKASLVPPLAHQPRVRIPVWAKLERQPSERAQCWSKFRMISTLTLTLLQQTFILLDSKTRPNTYAPPQESMKSPSHGLTLQLTFCPIFMKTSGVTKCNKRPVFTQFKTRLNTIM